MPIAPTFFVFPRNRYNFQTRAFAERKKRKPAEDAEALRYGRKAIAVAADVIDALDFTVTKSASNQELVEDDFPDYRAAYHKIYSSDWDVYVDPVAKLDDNGEEIGKNLSNKLYDLQETIRKVDNELLSGNFSEDGDENTDFFKILFDDDEKYYEFFTKPLLDKNSSDDESLSEVNTEVCKVDCPQNEINCEEKFSLSKDDAFSMVTSNPNRLLRLSEMSRVKEFLIKLLDLEPPIMVNDDHMKVFLKAYRAKIFNNISRYSIIDALDFFCSLLDVMEMPYGINCCTVMKMRKEKRADYLWGIDLLCRIIHIEYMGYNEDCCVIPVYWLHELPECCDLPPRKDCLPYCKYWTPILKEHHDFVQKLLCEDPKASDIMDSKLEGYDKLPEDLKQLCKEDCVKLLKMRDDMNMFMHFARWKLQGTISSAVDFSDIKSDGLFSYVERARQVTINYKQRSHDENLEDPEGVQSILEDLQFIFDSQLSFLEAQICYEYQNHDFNFPT